MADAVETAEVRVGPQGRLVIPASMRRALGIHEGDRLIARADGDRLVLEKREAIIAEVRDRFRVVPLGVSLADELITERREEARRADRV